MAIDIDIENAIQAYEAAKTELSNAQNAFAGYKLARDQAVTAMQQIQASVTTLQANLVAAKAALKALL